ncbi:MAG: lipid A export permease/ATP-binding protein MsbA [Rhodoferax sp.]|nr:lipid A export permease/ATP-binding protein MsbA [Rhodoferax sp.]
MPTDSAKPETLVFRLKRLLPYFGSLRGTWAIVVLSTVVGALTEPLTPQLLGVLLDEGLQKQRLEIWMVPASLLALFGVRGLAGYIAQIGLTRISNHGLLLLRRELFSTLLRGRLRLFTDQSSSSLSNTVVYEMQSGSGMLVNSVQSLARNGLTVLALTGYLFYMNWQLTLIVAAMFPAIAWVMRVLTRRLHRLTKANQDATDNLAYVVEENVLAHRDVRLFNAQASQAGRFLRLSESLQRLAMKSTVAGAAMTPITQMLAAVALSAVISVALVQSANNQTTVGEFVAFVTAMLMIIAPIRQLAEVSSPITRGLAALERGLELMRDTPVESEGNFEKARADGHIELREVSVQYGPDTAPALNKLSLSVQPGETLALVGASGSGKTTLVNLLPRFVDLQSGQVLLDGHALADWSLASLRQQFALVSQQVVMLNDTIAANVALGQAVDRDRVVHCLQMARLADMIANLPQGIDSMTGHNALQLSGGQRQRLAIARALYKDAPILILDEATSALDTESERLVQEALQGLMTNRTTIVIAHRLSTVIHANRIAVMDGGQIVETGSHQELLNQNGTYARLYRLGLHTSDGNLPSA